MSNAKVTPFLMFNDQLEAALELYTATFPGSEVKHVTRAGAGGPVMSAELVVGGQRFMAYNGGPQLRVVITAMTLSPGPGQ